LFAAQIFYSIGKLHLGEMSLGLCSDALSSEVFLTGWSFASQTARLCNLGRGIFVPQTTVAYIREQKLYNSVILGEAKNLMNA
jgi:hypothetical protein